MEPTVHPIFEKQTSTWQYIVACPETREAVIIDPVLDYSQEKLTINTTSADSLLDVVNLHHYKVVRLLETHAHADHLTAASYLQSRLQAQGANVPVCIGRRIRQVQDTFAKRYGVPADELDNAFEHLLEDNETFPIGNLTAKVLHLPGHTPDHVGYLIGSNVFTGDSIFNPDVGSARCDFPNGDAEALYQSMQKLLELPGEFKLYTGHDYPPSTSSVRREPMPFATVNEQRERNKHVAGGREQFVTWRKTRDSGLSEPRLLHQALQINIRGGKLPGSPDGSRRIFLQVPVTLPESWA
ncbi:Metallo-beta-lactamase superfamily protein [Aspergillus parasiticus SU-1]|uniref:Metallo-beta-lactamase superfamily protein n=1 Tax=Aspergillus parasiticus (strain ATCC 56775 / NRRL 5862 / SRRC 143 / SU-1) TaxID=1403190 RepID=A0A0F0I8A6_ASPPU|nr:Metallo-beta-lactamase superfamily protein [Aspergillus parasiticus SU-1]